MAKDKKAKKGKSKEEGADTDANLASSATIRSFMDAEVIKSNSSDVFPHPTTASGIPPNKPPNLPPSAAAEASPSPSGSPSPSPSADDDDHNIGGTEAQMHKVEGETEVTEDRPGKINFNLKGGIRIYSPQPLRLHISKEAHDDEKCIKINEYTDILHKFIESAKGEFCFALFGAWGRGKTFLANQLKKQIESQENYLVINFNAWKYRETPSIWVYLYDTFVSRAKKLGWIPYLVIVTRTACFKFPVFMFITTFLYILISIFIIYRFHNADILKILDNVNYYLSVISIFPIIALYKGKKLFDIPSHLAKFKKTYGQLTSHKEKLGIQEVIGSDLYTLIRAFVPKFKHVPRNHPHCLEYIHLSFTILFSILIILLANNNGYANIAIFNFLNFAIFIFFIPLIYYINFNKILLIIDDLDRCDPAQLLNVIESLKLLLEDDKINDKIQLVLLIEEENLRYSIYKRFEDFINFHPSNCEKTLNHDKVNGHIEKIITSYLRLPDLSHEDCLEIFDHYLNYDPLKSNNETINKKVTNKDELDILLKNEDISIYDEEEQNFLRSLYPQPHGWTPRKIRLFLFRYQLCRLIRTRLHLSNITNKDIINSLSDNLEGLELLGDDESQRREILWLTNQVT